MKKILTATEKHGTIYFDVSSDELLHKTSVIILTNRLNKGWFGDDKWDDASLKKINSKIKELEEDVVKISNEEARKEIEKQIKYNKQEKDIVEKSKIFRESVREIIKVEFEHIPQNYPKKSQNEWARKCAWTLLSSRSDAEYEEVDIDRLWDVTNKEDEEELKER